MWWLVCRTPMFASDVDNGARFHHQLEAQHPPATALDKLPADYPIHWQLATFRTVAQNGL
jgi:hypothetical protein